MKSAILSCAILFLCAAASADVLILDDGTRLEGKAHKNEDQWVVTDSSGHDTVVDAGRVTSIEIGGDDSPQTRLELLRHSVANSSDLKQIIARFEKFIQTNAGSDAAKAANEDLSIWQNRLASHCAKVGSRWLTPQEREDLISTEAVAAQHIGALLQSGRTEEAQAALKDALSLDPQDPAAIYLNGLVLADQNENVAARDQFEQLEKIVRNHGPTLNNLAVILWRQRLQPAAIKIYAQAMAAAPRNKAILDNVAEALHDLPEENRDSVLVRQALALFVQQDRLLQKKQRSLGLARWGATWVPFSDLPKLQLEDQSIESQLAAIKSDYDQTEASIAVDDAQIQQTQTAILNEQYAAPQPPNFQQLQQDLVLLAAARKVGVDHLAELDKKADRVERTRSVPKFTGLLQLIGPEGTPIREEAPETLIAP